jgi:phage tail-like protein
MANTNKDNNTGKRRDPLPAFCFLVDLKISGDAAEQAFFKSVSGLSSEAEVVEVREGGVNDTTFKLVGPMKWKNLVFKQGFVALSAQQPSSLLSWREKWMSGVAKNMVRSTGKITMLDTALKEMATWTFYRGWPVKWEIGELDASKNELAIETLEIAHEGLKFEK